MIEALRKGNEAVYRALVDRYTATLLRLASMYVSNTEVTADVTQETWIGVLQGHRQSDAVGLSSPSPSFAENRHLNGPLRLRSGVCRVRIASS
jgi:DNA-directed RNA polymerase specialized sigma24 family protein